MMLCEHHTAVSPCSFPLGSMKFFLNMLVLKWSSGNDALFLQLKIAVVCESQIWAFMTSNMSVSQTHAWWLTVPVKLKGCYGYFFYIFFFFFFYWFCWTSLTWVSETRAQIRASLCVIPSLNVPSFQFVSSIYI